MSLFFLSLVSLISCTNACDRCVHEAKVAFFNEASQSSYAIGACGYGPLAMDLSGGALARAAPKLYRTGLACGACFQIRCKDTNMCSRGGSQVIVTDLSEDNSTDFVLSSKAFMAMAKDGMGQNLLTLGIVDVEYQRVPCAYQNRNLAVRVRENSRRPNYLEINFLYQGGQTDIIEVDVAQVGLSNWSSMTRVSGAIWSMTNVPQGALQFRMMVQSGFDGKSIWATNVLPEDWYSGVIYDTGVQITDIAQEGCYPCDDTIWK